MKNIFKYASLLFLALVVSGCRGKDGVDGSPGGSGAVYTGSITTSPFNFQIDNLDNNDSINVYYAETTSPGFYYQANGCKPTDFSQPCWVYAESGSGYSVTIYNLNGKNFKIVVWRAAGISSLGLSSRFLD